jgi:hypothetical protein
MVQKIAIRNVGDHDTRDGAGLVKTVGMRSSTVAFRGTKQVVGAYRANDMAPWAICSGKDIMFAFEEDDMEQGAQMLEEMLRKMEEGGSMAVYHLLTYEMADLGPSKKIKSNTPITRSFPFKIWYNDGQADDNYGPTYQGRRQLQAEAEERVKKLEDEIKYLKDRIESEEQQEEEERPGGIAGIISGFMEMPGMKEALTAKLVGFVNEKIFPMKQNRPAAVAGIQAPPDVEAQSILTPEQQTRAQNALNLLCTLDPMLGDHLEKIARIAVENPGQYNWLVGMLK